MERFGEAATEDWSGYDMGRRPGVGSRTRGPGDGTARAGPVAELPGGPGASVTRSADVASG